MVFGTWDLMHGKNAGAQGIVIGAGMGLVALAVIFHVLRGKQTQSVGTLAEGHSSGRGLLDKILLSFVLAIAFFFIFLALADVR